MRHEVWEPFQKETIPEDLEDVIEDPGGWSDVFPDIVITVGIVSDF